MSSNFLVKPAPGAVVFDPQRGDQLPPEGRNVERNQYWFRRIEEGSVTEIEEKPLKKEASKP